jgi:hypothetical protein
MYPFEQPLHQAALSDQSSPWTREMATFWTQQHGQGPIIGQIRFNVLTWPPSSSFPYAAPPDSLNENNAIVAPAVILTHYNSSTTPSPSHLDSENIISVPSNINNFTAHGLTLSPRLDGTTSITSSSSPSLTGSSGASPMVPSRTHMSESFDLQPSQTRFQPQPNLIGSQSQPGLINFNPASPAHTFASLSAFSLCFHPPEPKYNSCSRPTIGFGIQDLMSHAQSKTYLPPKIQPHTFQVRCATAWGAVSIQAFFNAPAQRHLIKHIY